MLYAPGGPVAATPPLGALALPRRADDEHAAPSTDPFAPLPYRLYAGLGFASLLVHLCGANRVFNVPFHVANVAPLLLGLAVLLGRSTRLPKFAVANLQMVLAASAVLMSLHFPADLATRAAGVALTPLRCALVGAAAVSLYALWHHRRLAFASVATACLATAALGRDVNTMRANIFAMLRWLLDTGLQLIPTTPMQWGVAAVVASFVLLAIGAAISLGRPAAATGPLEET